MKIYPCSPYSFKHSNNKISAKNGKQVKPEVAAIVCLATLAGIGATTYLVKSSDKKNITQNIIKNFAEDIKYREGLMQTTVLKNKSVSSLSPIAGQEEYKKIIQSYEGKPLAYTPGASLITESLDLYELQGKENKTFRISLHNHTNHSDGKMSVSELLEQAANYADEVAESLKTQKDVDAPWAPFTIAITDHDTVEGCKEAVEIISKNPEKYKNLRVILGIELTVENKMLGDALNKPIQTHMVVNAINPFDKDLNLFLDGKKESRKAVAKEIFQLCQKDIEKFDKNLANTISLEEAEELYPTLKNGLNYPWYYVKDYIISKSDKSKQDELTKIIKNIQKQYEPTMELKPFQIDMEEAMEVIKKQKSGYMTIAHPALTDIGRNLKNPEKAFWGISEMFKLFKEKGGEKALATEIYYPYYGAVGKSTNWLNNIEKSAKDNNLLLSGGLDSHGKSIFYSNK